MKGFLYVLVHLLGKRPPGYGVGFSLIEYAWVRLGFVKLVFGHSHPT